MHYTNSNPFSFLFFVEIQVSATALLEVLCCFCVRGVPSYAEQRQGSSDGTRYQVAHGGSESLGI